MYLQILILLFPIARSAQKEYLEDTLSDKLRLSVDSNDDTTEIFGILIKSNRSSVQRLSEKWTQVEVTPSPLTLEIQNAPTTMEYPNVTTVSKIVNDTTKNSGSITEHNGNSTSVKKTRRDQDYGDIGYGLYDDDDQEDDEYEEDDDYEEDETEEDGDKNIDEENVDVVNQEQDYDNYPETHQTIVLTKKRKKKKKIGKKHGSIKLKDFKKLKKFMLPLLIAYKLKFFTLVPLLLGGLVVIVATTGFAGFFFALFAVGLGLKHK